MAQAKLQRQVQSTCNASSLDGKDSRQQDYERASCHSISGGLTRPRRTQAPPRRRAIMAPDDNKNALSLSQASIQIDGHFHYNPKHCQI